METNIYTLRNFKMIRLNFKLADATLQRKVVDGNLNPLNLISVLLL